MERVEERVAFVEGRLEEQTVMVNEFRQAMVALEERLDRRFEHIDARFLQIEARFTQMDGRIDALDAKMSRQFVWLVGLFVTIAITMVGAVMSVVSSALAR
jgi:uncharacterized coiled-coil protein SlyX